MSHIFKPDSVKLDWVSRHDPRSWSYRAMSRLRLSKRYRCMWSPGPVLNQGKEGACVGMAWAQEAWSSPVRVGAPDTDEYRHRFAQSIYHEARKVDEWEGEAYEGTSVLAGAKVMQARGFLIRYEWCFSTAEIVSVLLHRGPVVLGIPWFTDMFYPDTLGRITPGGRVEGGHAILAIGYEPAWPNRTTLGNPMIKLQNSWGWGWGRDGAAWISVDDLGNLLKDGGEACVPAARSFGYRQDRTRRVQTADTGGLT